jgi:hypothetical protein
MDAKEKRKYDQEQKRLARIKEDLESERLLKE